MKTSPEALQSLAGRLAILQAEARIVGDAHQFLEMS
jgi:hypothetical protein